MYNREDRVIKKYSYLTVIIKCLDILNKNTGQHLTHLYLTPLKINAHVYIITLLHIFLTLSNKTNLVITNQ